ncbi:MAG: aldo/keto reductase, partial [Caldilineaceae bacterium]|nr:aldo/keto reductase [Caldilineaceae bacterium]
KTFGKTGWQVSTIGLGTWNIGNQWGEIDDVTAYATIHAAIESGMNLIDTADAYGIPYGLSEKRLGRALGGIRHQLYVVSKVGNWGRRMGYQLAYAHPDHVRLCIHASLGRLRTDYLDVSLCHESNLGDPTVYLEGFEQLVQEGSIRAYGISTNSLEVLKRFNVNGTCSVVQVDYSLLNRAPEAEFLPYCQEQNIGVMVRGPLAKGVLSGRYDAASTFTDTVRQGWNDEGAARDKFLEQVAQVDRLKQVVKPGPAMVTTALRYVISHPAIATAIPGAKSPEQARTNAAAGDTLLSAAECERLVNALQG